MGDNRSTPENHSIERQTTRGQARKSSGLFGKQPSSPIPCTVFHRDFTQLKAGANLSGLGIADEHICLDTTPKDLSDKDVGLCNLPCVNVADKKVDSPQSPSVNVTHDRVDPPNIASVDVSDQKVDRLGASST